MRCVKGLDVKSSSLRIRFLPSVYRSHFLVPPMWPRGMDCTWLKILSMPSLGGFIVLNLLEAFIEDDKEEQFEFIRNLISFARVDELLSGQELPCALENHIQ